MSELKTREPTNISRKLKGAAGGGAAALLLVEPLDMLLGDYFSPEWIAALATLVLTLLGGYLMRDEK